MQRQSVLSICGIILTTIVVLITLQQGKEIFAPILSALILGVILTPLSDLWDRLRLPDAFSAFLTVAIALFAILVMVLLIEPYVTMAVNQAPVIWNELRGTVTEFQRILRGLEELSDDVASAIEPASEGSNGEAASTVVLPSLTDALFLAPHFAAQFLIFTGTLYFFLMSKTGIYSWVSGLHAQFGETELRMAAKQVSRYVLTISAINLTFGIFVVIAMHFLGMPSPVIWGILAFALNFILYLGPIAMVAMLTITGIVVFDGPSSFLPAAVYLAMNATEAQFVTPTMVGKSLSVNPLTVFLSLVFWLWLWGPIGGIIAIPLLIWCLTVLKGATDQTTVSDTRGQHTTRGPTLPTG